MSKTAIITGISGQDAAYLAHFLLEKGYRVIGIGRSLENNKLWRLVELGLLDKIEVVSGDISDATFVLHIMAKYKPDECYNFAAVSFVGQSWVVPSVTMNINTTGVLNLLEAIRQMSPETKLYQAGSSEMFGRPVESIQNEKTEFKPCNPYGVSKVAAFQLVDIYRSAYNVFACNAICYNHESPLRGMEYVTRKITDGVVRIKYGLLKEIRLGNIQSRRDWGYAKDYVEAMWLMLQQPAAGDYILATGVTHSIEEFLSTAFELAGISDWRNYVVEDERFFRPLEPHQLCGNPQKAKEQLGWKPKVDFSNLVAEMVRADEQRILRI